MKINHMMLLLLLMLIITLAACGEEDSDNNDAAETVTEVDTNSTVDEPAAPDDTTTTDDASTISLDATFETIYSTQLDPDENPVDFSGNLTVAPDGSIAVQQYFDTVAFLQADGTLVNTFDFQENLPIFEQLQDIAYGSNGILYGAGGDAVYTLLDDGTVEVFAATPEEPVDGINLQSQGFRQIEAGEDFIVVLGVGRSETESGFLSMIMIYDYDGQLIANFRPVLETDPETMNFNAPQINILPDGTLSMLKDSRDTTGITRRFSTDGTHLGDTTWAYTEDVDYGATAVTGERLLVGSSFDPIIILNADTTLLGQVGTPIERPDDVDDIRTMEFTLSDGQIGRDFTDLEGIDATTFLLSQRDSLNFYLTHVTLAVE